MITGCKQTFLYYNIILTSFPWAERAWLIKCPYIVLTYIHLIGFFFSSLSPSPRRLPEVYGSWCSIVCTRNCTRFPCYFTEANVVKCASFLPVIPAKLGAASYASNFWDMFPCRPVVHWRFGGTSCLQFFTVKETPNIIKANFTCCLMLFSWLLGSWTCRQEVLPETWVMLTSPFCVTRYISELKMVTERIFEMLTYV